MLDHIRDGLDEIRILNKEDGTVDNVLSMHTATTGYYVSLAWIKQARREGLGDFTPNWYRMQLERFIWDEKATLLDKRVMDVGQVIDRREWIGSGYFTYGLKKCNVLGDIQDIKLPDESIDHVICSEVLEHVENPFKAVEEIYRILRPGGMLIASAPFMLPYHGSINNPDQHSQFYDYWRFTPDSWDLILKDFPKHDMFGMLFTSEGYALLDLVRRFEGWGFKHEVSNLVQGIAIKAIK